MKITFMRQDRDANPVEVEIWSDEKTGEFVRIKRVTYCKKSNFTRFRTDIYMEGDKKEFKKYLDEEIRFLSEYQKVLENIMGHVV